MADETETSEAPPKVPDKDPIDLLIERLADEPFDMGLEEHPFSVKSKLDGKIINYILRELDAAGREEYMDFQAKMALYKGDGKMAGIRDIRGMDSKIVWLSVRDAAGQQVPEVVIKTWPGKFTKNLAAIARRISGLDDK